MSPVERAVDAMNASLRREYKRILHLLGADPETVESRHAVGLIVAAVKGEPRKYGKQAIGLLATALGRDEATLYRFAQLASRWTATELGEWRARGEVTEHPLSWWHFVEASAVSRRRVREELLRRAVEDGLSVRALARLAEGNRATHRPGSRLVREVAVLIRRTKVLRDGWETLRATSTEEMRRAMSRGFIERAKHLHADLIVEAQKALESIVALSTETDLEEPHE